MNISVVDLGVGENAIAGISAVDLFNVNVDVILVNHNIGTDVKNGKGNYDLGDKLFLGEHNATVKYGGNG